MKLLHFRTLVDFIGLLERIIIFIFSNYYCRFASFRSKSSVIQSILASYSCKIASFLVILVVISCPFGIISAVPDCSFVLLDCDVY